MEININGIKVIIPEDINYNNILADIHRAAAKEIEGHENYLNTFSHGYIYGLEKAIEIIKSHREK